MLESVINQISIQDFILKLNVYICSLINFFVFLFSFSKNLELGLWIVRYVFTASLFCLAFNAPGVFQRHSALDIENNSESDVSYITRIFFTILVSVYPLP